MWASVALLCTTILAGYMALNSQSKLVGLQADYDALLERVESMQGSLEDLTIQIDMRIDYGEGNIVWYNSTRIPLNAKLLEATEIIAPVDYTLSDYGAIVNEISEVGGDEGFFWLSLMRSARLAETKVSSGSGTPTRKMAGRWGWLALTHGA